MKPCIFLLLLLLKFIYILDTSVEDEVRDIYSTDQQLIVWNSKVGEIKYYRFYLFQYSENKEIDIQIKFIKDYQTNFEDNPCSNYSLIYINTNFTPTATKEDIINNENYVNTSLSCYSDSEGFPYITQYYVISTRYKVPKIDVIGINDHKVIGLKTQTFVENQGGFYYLNITKVKEKEEESTVEKVYIWIKRIIFGLIGIMIILLICILIYKKCRACLSSNNSAEYIASNNKRNEDSQNQGLLPQ